MVLEEMKIFPKIVMTLCTAGILGTSVATGADECRLDAVEVFEQGGPSTVQIVALNTDPFTTIERAQWAGGSGIVVDADGLVLTNSHVVHSSPEIVVWLDEPTQRRKATIVGDDPITDLALIRVFGGIPGAVPAKFREPGSLRIGEPVFAIGNALGLGKTVSHGIVSGLERQIWQRPLRRDLALIQTDAAINPGNSGGPLFDACARVLGVNTVKASAVGIDNVGFAVPVTIASDVMVKLREHGRVPRPWHGINGQLVDPVLSTIFNFPLHPGLLVETIEPGSPAETVGLRAGTLPVNIGTREFLLGGDILISVNEIPLESEGAIERAIDSLEIGMEVKLRYWRDGTEHEINVILPERPILSGDIVYPRRE
jgi:S1-C subfamily serine protease